MQAYYGAFNVARRWLESNVTPIDNRRAHHQVWQTFITADHAGVESQGTWRLIGRLGDSLHQLRNEVDYKDEVNDLGSRVQPAIGAAERILLLLAELNQRPRS